MVSNAPWTFLTAARPLDLEQPRHWPDDAAAGRAVGLANDALLTLAQPEGRAFGTRSHDDKRPRKAAPRDDRWRPVGHLQLRLSRGERRGQAGAHHLLDPPAPPLSLDAETDGKGQWACARPSHPRPAGTRSAPRTVMAPYVCGRFRRTLVTGPAAAPGTRSPYPPRAGTSPPWALAGRPASACPWNAPQTPPLSTGGCSPECG